MATNVKIRKEIGLYQIAIRAAEKASKDLKATYAAIQDSDLLDGDVRWKATEDLARSIDSLRDTIHNLNYRVMQAESLDEQIQREHFNTLGSATAAALNGMTPLERSRLTGH